MQIALACAAVALAAIPAVAQPRPNTYRSQGAAAAPRLISPEVAADPPHHLPSARSQSFRGRAALRRVES